MKSKKGFMLGEYTLKMIIAVLCILLLLYLLFSLYSNNKDQKNLQLAEASLNELVGKMGEAKESGSAEITVLNPSGWTLINYYNNENKPNLCIGNCICLCDTEIIIEFLSKRVGLGATIEEKRQKQMKNCNKLSVCKPLDNSMNELYMDIPADMDINFKDNKFTIAKK
ncbi:MAG: hypothetical protein Q8N63_04430 [Nanoarchaeota archaeon]|nr:hypothetical protein [Nanoarchaeota archaeon]